MIILIGNFTIVCTLLMQNVIYFFLSVMINVYHEYWRPTGLSWMIFCWDQICNLLHNKTAHIICILAFYDFKYFMRLNNSNLNCFYVFMYIWFNFESILIHFCLYIGIWKFANIFKISIELNFLSKKTWQTE